jgi:hypothetical protein
MTDVELVTACGEHTRQIALRSIVEPRRESKDNRVYATWLAGR